MIKTISMLKKTKCYVIALLISMSLLTSCKLSTNELTQEVRYSMMETWKKENFTDISIRDLTLTHKSGNEYAGILETIEDGQSIIYSVEVIYDGENMQWEILN